MKILVTGGCGFIGVNLCRLLVGAGHQVSVIDNLSLGKQEHLEGLPVRLIIGDLRDRPALARAVLGQDAVVHLAADTRVIPAIENPARNFEMNVIGTFNLLEEMRAAGVRRLVNASTGGAILGEAPTPVHEEMVPKPLSPYGASKLACEGYVSAYSASYGMQAASLRFSNVYGPRSIHKGSVVAHFIKEVRAGRDLVIYGDGGQTRDYIFVEDLCRGIEACINAGGTGVFQLGSGTPTTLNRLVEILRQQLPRPQFSVRYEPWRRGEIRHTYGDISKAADAWGFRAQTDLESGISQTWDWFAEHPALLQTA